MCFWKGPRLGSRTLRFKDRGGPDVNQLHELLRSQGYDLGEEPDYGYLTKDAVRQFQREHGLIADGIAGGARFFCFSFSGRSAHPQADACGPARRNVSPNRRGL